MHANFIYRCLIFKFNARRNKIGYNILTHHKSFPYIPPLFSIIHDRMEFARNILLSAQHILFFSKTKDRRNMMLKSHAMMPQQNMIPSFSIYNGYG